jgi:hypothetical protein
MTMGLGWAMEGPAIKRAIAKNTTTTAITILFIMLLLPKLLYFFASYTILNSLVKNRISAEISLA